MDGRPTASTVQYWRRRMHMKLPPLLLLLSLPALLLFNITSGSRTSAATDVCAVHSRDCSTFANKVPSVLTPVAPQTAVTAALNAASRRTFEHMLGNALRETPAVQWATRAFASRMTRFLVRGAALNGTSADAALTAAFISSACGPRNTGYVGPSLPAIRIALASGNVRETWALMYVLTKTHFVTTLLNALLSTPAPGGSRVGATATPRSLGARFGMNAVELAARWELVQQTRSLSPTGLRYAQGMPDFEYESFDSWVRFDFTSRTRDGRMQWRAARTHRESGCSAVAARTDDASLEPPLSTAELSYQCGALPPPCKLQWQPGASCFDLPNVSWELPSGQVLPGLRERVASAGYRAAAGASGTTANILQLALLLGFTSEELVVIRLAMLAWMLPTDDHSFIEILLGADAYVPLPYRSALGLRDFERMWPPQATLTTGGGAFHGADVWSALARRFMTPAGRQLLAGMAPTARVHFSALLSAGSSRAGDREARKEMKHRRGRKLARAHPHAERAHADGDVRRPDSTEVA